MKIDTEFEFENKKIIPQPADKGTRWYTTIERIRDRLPSTEGMAGKVLKVDADEEGCSWVAGGGGGTVSFADITGDPADNAALGTALSQKVDVPAGSTRSCSLGCDDEGPYLEV